MNTPLMIAANQGYHRSIHYLLKRGADPTLLNVYGNTALMEAVGRNDHRCIKALCPVSRNLINHRNEDGDTALIIASRYGNEQIVKEILKYRPDLDICNKVRRSLLLITSAFSYHHYHLI